MNKLPLPKQKQHLIFIIIFTIIGLLALQAPFSELAGSKVKFSLFDFFSPIAPAFIGTLPGVVAVFFMRFFDFLIHGGAGTLHDVFASIKDHAPLPQDLGAVIRLFPTLFAALYFGKRNKISLIFPALAILAFVIHPVGRTVWFFSLFWTIPLICHFAWKQSLFMRALGATFSAHAVGGAIWIYVFNLPKEAWISLVPVVIVERLLFAVGISLTYIVFNNALHFLSQKKHIKLRFRIDTKYLFPKFPKKTASLH